MNRIGERIKFVRNRENLTQKQFADRILVTQSYLSRVESGKENPNDKLLKLIALEFHISTAWLEKGEGIPEINKENFDYFCRADSTELKELLEEYFDDLLDLAKNDATGIVSLNVGAILIEIKNYLKTSTSDSESVKLLIFQKITSDVLELFLQLKDIDSEMDKSELHSRFWMCTTALTDTLREIEEILSKRTLSDILEDLAKK